MSALLETHRSRPSIKYRSGRSWEHETMVASLFPISKFSIFNTIIQISLSVFFLLFCFSPGKKISIYIPEMQNSLTGK